MRVCGFAFQMLIFLFIEMSIWNIVWVSIWKLPEPTRNDQFPVFVGFDAYSDEIDHRVRRIATTCSDNNPTTFRKEWCC